MTDPQILISRYLGCSLTPEEILELRTWILGSPANAREYAMAIFLHRAIYRTMNGRGRLRDLDAMALGDSGDSVVGVRLADVDKAASDRDVASADRRGIEVPGAVIGTKDAIDATDDTIGPAAHSADSARRTKDTTDTIDAIARSARVPIAAKPRRRGPGWGWRAAAALLLLSAAAALLVLHRPADLGIAATGPQSQPIATPIKLFASLDAIWANPDAIPTAGSAVRIGATQSLTSGYVKLAGDNGLAIIIQGPASFAVQGPGTVSLTSGHLTAMVPAKARGFTINTPTASVVDLGTEFGVSVSAAGTTSVCTFRGTVAVTPMTNDASRNLVVAGSARQVSASGRVAQIPADTAGFVRPQQFDDWNTTTPTTSYQRWSAYAERLRHDPDMVAYYTFDQDSAAANRLENLSSAGTALDGILGGNAPADSPTWTTGRWPQKGALAFDGQSHRAWRFPRRSEGCSTFRGEQTASPFTICIWVRVDGPQQPESSIVAKGIDRAEQFAIDNIASTELRGWVREAPPRGTGGFPSHVNLTRFKSDSWQHVVLTYSPDSGTLRCYSNGALIDSIGMAPTRLLETATPLVIGSREGPPFARRRADGTIPRYNTMNGRIDELAIFRRALSADRVREMYLAEKPE